MELGTVRKIDIDREMQQAYLDYAMSVIVSRALPDARDGLKPVHRRILYAMYDMGLRADSSHKKSARIVGEVLGKYHPHGDAAVYDAMARMVQDFSLRYPLVDGQGNFGSVDGDSPAAMRYTEARMAPPAMHMLTDIQKNTVDFEQNFDDSLSEPSVLPSAIPNLLVNGATGIAVGMSTNVPPHNLSEVIDALNYILDRWEKIDDISLDELMQHVKGPDFPTGGIIIHDSEDGGLQKAYSTGRGRVTVQARAHLEEMGRGRSRIIVTELPFMTNKSNLIERIASLTREGKLEGITDLRDESDREGMRIVIELSKSIDPDQVLRDLYRRTPMQNTFGIIMLALVNGEPRLLSLKQSLRVYLEHRQEVIRRRSEYDLEKSRERAHILEGLLVALKNLDEVINLIRRSPDVETARSRLMRKYKLSEIQAQAILNMPLRRLASLERKKIQDEFKEITATIKDLEGLLKSPKKMRALIGEELVNIKNHFGDHRRTQIVKLGEGEVKSSLLTATDLVPEKDIWVSITADGLVSASMDNKVPRLSGRTAPAWLVQVNTRDTLYLIAENGEAAAIGVHTLPNGEKAEDGTHFSRLSPLTEKSKLAAVFNLPESSQINEGWYVLSVTHGGMIKKSALEELPGPTAQTFTLVKVNDGDRLGWVHITNGENEIMLTTAKGLAIRFIEEEVRPMGLIAAGVMGIKLKVGDEVIGSEVLPADGEVFLIRTDGQAKRVKIDQFPTQGRYGQGVVAWKLPAKSGLAGMAIGKPTTRATIHLQLLAAKSIRFDDAPVRGRPSNGKSILDLKTGDSILQLTAPITYPRPFGDKGPKPKKKRGAKKK